MAFIVPMHHYYTILLRLSCDTLVALVSIFIEFYKFVWQVFLFTIIVLVMECGVVLIGIPVWILVQWICGIICHKIY